MSDPDLTKDGIYTEFVTRKIVKTMSFLSSLIIFSAGYVHQLPSSNGKSKREGLSKNFYQCRKAHF